MCSETIHIAGRYNKYLRNLSQSPWIDKDDVRIKHSVQELIEDGLKEYLKFDKSIFSSSGREDVDVRMLGRGRPFVFKLTNPWDASNYNQKTMKSIQDYVNRRHRGKVAIRDLQVVTKESVSKNLMDGQESKMKEYRALCCCSRPLNDVDFEKVSKSDNLYINQLTPIRVLHRRSLAVRRRKVQHMSVERVKVGDFDSVKEENLNRLFALNLVTEAGTYIKEFVHGDFGRTEPCLYSILGDCDTDLMELDVMEVYLDWPPALDNNSTNGQSCPLENQDNMDRSEIGLAELFNQGLKLMEDAEKLPRGDARQDSYIRSRRCFEKAADLVGSLSLFSDNETIDDVATADLRYLLVPAYLAKVFVSSECGPNRLETFEKAETWILKFLKIICQYGLGDENIEQSIKNATSSPTTQAETDLKSAMMTRDGKIEKFKKMKLLEHRLSELERQVKGGQEVDDEVKREYYLQLIKKWIDDTHECLDREVKPALLFERNRSGNTSGELESIELPEAGSSMRMKPFTIVKNEAQKQVFGIGYPSRPTVTVDEFITKKINDGDLAFHAQKEVYANSLQRYAEQPNLMREQEEDSDAEREDKEEKEDLDELKRKRDWDNFKDENPRGSGNRHNMG